MSTGCSRSRIPPSSTHLTLTSSGTSPTRSPAQAGSSTERGKCSRALEAIGDLFDAQPEPEEFLSAGETLIVLGTWRARARVTGILVEVPFAHVLRFRDGKLVYFRNYIDSAQPLKALEESPSG